MSDVPLIFICKTGSITQPSKVDLRKAGVVVVEVTHPADCSLLRGEAMYDDNALLRIAMQALASEAGTTSSGSMNAAGRQKENFVALMAEMLKARAKS